MLRRALTTIVCFALFSACSPTLPPTTVPEQTDPTFEPFKTSLQAYVDATQPLRKQAAVDAEKVPGKDVPATGAEQSVRTRQNSLADALRLKVRPNAKQGDLFTLPMAAAFTHQIQAVFNTPQRGLLFDDLAEQNSTPANTQLPEVNARLVAPRVPPRLSELLPPLPKQLEYDFVGRTLVLRDVDADVVVDFLPNALPAIAPANTETAEPTPLTSGASAASLLPMPSIRGGTVFALMGDSGSGNQSQHAVAKAMLAYFNTARRFPFVLMLGDNLYDDDYTNEFSIPYKPLIDLGVKFYAALGNHDRDLEIHFKPFNMNDVDRYTFDQGNARFAALNSNHPGDPLQIKWLDTAFAGAETKWKICFFHHPLYSSGEHAAEGRDVIRPALEGALVRNKVDVVFTGHEHLYEHIKPQQGVQYFISGGGGKNLFNFHKSEFDVVIASEHHFMVAEIDGDRLFFEAITQTQKILDCGIIFRTTEAAAKTPDDTAKNWMASCDEGRARPRTTQ
jgi:hypothetical protein